MCAPTLEAGIKKEIRKSHEPQKTKEVLAFDDGLVEQPGTFSHNSKANSGGADES